MECRHAPPGSRSNMNGGAYLLAASVNPARLTRFVCLNKTFSSARSRRMAIPACTGYHAQGKNDGEPSGKSRAAPFLLIAFCVIFRYLVRYFRKNRGTCASYGNCFHIPQNSRNFFPPALSRKVSRVVTYVTNACFHQAFENASGLKSFHRPQRMPTLLAIHNTPYYAVFPRFSWPSVPVANLSKIRRRRFPFGGECRYGYTLTYIISACAIES